MSSFLKLATVLSFVLALSGAANLAAGEKAPTTAKSGNLFKTCLYEFRGPFGIRKYYSSNNPSCTIACVSAQQKCLDAQGPGGVLTCHKVKCD